MNLLLCFVYSMGIYGRVAFVCPGVWEAREPQRKVTENDVSRLRPTSRKFWQRLSNRKRFSHQTASAQGFARYGVGKRMASKGQQSSIHDLQMYEHFTGCVECQSILTNSASAMYSRSVSSTNWQNDVLKAFQNAIFVHHDHELITIVLHCFQRAQGCIGLVLKMQWEAEVTKWEDARYSTMSNVNRNCHNGTFHKKSYCSPSPYILASSHPWTRVLYVGL